MKNIKSAVEHLKKGVFEDYTFAIYDGGVIVATTDTKYQDLTAWKNLEFEMLSLLKSDLRISSVKNHSPYQRGIETWNKEMCFLKFEINFLSTH